MRMLENIQEDLKSQKRSMREMEENIKNSINKNIDEKFQCIETRTIQLEQKIEQQQTTINFLDKKLRKRNLIFFGVDETERTYDELVNIILSLINTKMGVSCQKGEIETAGRLGKKAEKMRPVIVTVTTTGRKLEILRNKKSLLSSAIYVKEDYPPQVLQKRKELQDQLKKEREAGKKVALRYDKIVTFGAQSTAGHSYNKKISNKRFMSESPESVEVRKIGQNEERSKQIPKKTKPQDITSFLRPSQLNPTNRPNTSTRNEGVENGKN